MGTIAASRILDRAAKTLLDETGVQWNPTELLDYLNAGQNAVVANKPDAYVVNASIPLETGRSLQTIPADGYQFLDAVVNSGTTANPASNNLGRAIRQVERNHLDRSNPDWHTDRVPLTGDAAEIGQIKHVIHDKRDPKNFYVHPRPDVGVSPANQRVFIRVLYAAHPPVLASSASIIAVDDLYENALHSWVVGYAYAKNSKRGDLNKANAYFTMFANSIGAKSQVQFAFAPLPADADSEIAREPS